VSLENELQLTAQSVKAKDRSSLLTVKKKEKKERKKKQPNPKK